MARREVGTFYLEEVTNAGKMPALHASSPSPDREDEDADPACSGLFEGTSTFGGSGSGGEDIINEKDAFSDNIGWALECADQVF